MNYQASDIIWSIYVDTDIAYEAWEDFTKVGCDDDIAYIPDGEYTVDQPCLQGGKWSTFQSSTKVKVIDGHVDVNSCLQATAEILNASNTWHVFIEQVLFNADNNTITLTLGS